MSNSCSIRIFLACVLAASAVADSEVPENKVFPNWQWSVALVKEPTPDLDTLVRFPQPSDQKTTELVEKTCKDIKKKLSELANVTFYDNPPFEGRILLVLTLKRDVVGQNH